MILEKFIGCKPIFIIQVTSSNYKKGLVYNTKYCLEWLQIKEQLAKANCSVLQGGKEKRLPCHLYY